MTGMLWFDNDPRTTLSAKVEKAMECYRKKYGRPPEVCLVHPSAISDGRELKVGEMIVRPCKSVLLNHLWIGVEEEK
jgi:hypothetical protein